LPAITGNIGLRGGGLFYSTSGYVPWGASEAANHTLDCPPPPRIVNMNRIGAALMGEIQGPPIKSLYVFAANPVTSAPNASLTIKGLQRDDLFTVVHELFMTDTARYADIVLPATSQLEHLDLHKAYGHRNLQLNTPAIAPLGEAKSNWDVMRLLAAALGYSEPWLQESGEDVIRAVLDEMRATQPQFADVTWERLVRDGTVPLAFDETTHVPFADRRFPTPSGKVELWSATMAEMGVDPLPDYVVPAEFANRNGQAELVLISGASHHFVSSSMANQPSLRAKEGQPFVEINPADAAARGICNGDDVVIENRRGACTLRAVVTEDAPVGVVVAPKGAWGRLSRDGRNVNWTTSDALADVAGQSTFHSNLVTLRPAE
jgi:anaerobic selenocysteine-containing dehydrogenase